MTNGLKISAGDLRNTISIEQLTETRSATGAISNSWSNFATIRAKIAASTGTETFIGAEFLSEKTHDITIRYLPGITPKMRVNFTLGCATRLFDILQVIDIEERRRVMHIVAREAVRGKGI